MQVILKKSVRNLGQVGDTVKVASGYGRNYLLPREIAIRATDDNIAKFDAIRQNLKDKNQQDHKQAEANKAKISGKTITFVAQSGSDGKLFGSITAKTIAAKLSEELNTEIAYNNVLLETPIKFNGVYSVQLSLHSDVETEIQVVIAKSDAEAQTLLAEHKKAATKEEAQDK